MPRTRCMDRGSALCRHRKPALPGSYAHVCRGSQCTAALTSGGFDRGTRRSPTAHARSPALLFRYALDLRRLPNRLCEWFSFALVFQARGKSVQRAELKSLKSRRNTQNNRRAPASLRSRHGPAVRAGVKDFVTFGLIYADGIDPNDPASLPAPAAATPNGHTCLVTT